MPAASSPPRVPVAGVLQQAGGTLDLGDDPPVARHADRAGGLAYGQGDARDGRGYAGGGGVAVPRPAGSGSGEVGRR